MRIFIVCFVSGLIISLLAIISINSPAEAGGEWYTLIRAKDGCFYNKMRSTESMTKEYQYIHSEACKNPKHRLYRTSTSSVQ
jgi:hypothetical protein